MEKNCFELVRGLLGKAEYENRSKKRKQDFSKERNMSFKKLMYFMPGMVKESPQNALERLFPKIKEAVPMTQAGIRPGAAKGERGTIGSEGGRSGIVPSRREGKL
jgi:hypothetical protein